MRKMSSCVLIAFRPDAHEVGSEPAETKRKVKCQELGLTQADIYQAGGEGLRPEAKLLIPYDRIYKGERALEYQGERWTVIHSDPYKEFNGVILAIRRDKGNAGDPTPPAVPATSTAPETAQEVGE